MFNPNSFIQTQALRFFNTLYSISRSVHHPILHHVDCGGDAAAAARAGPGPEAKGGRRWGLEKGEISKHKTEESPTCGSDLKYVGAC